MKKGIIAGVAAIAVSFVLMIVFIVGGVSSIQSGPAGTLEKLEKAINKGESECFKVNSIMNVEAIMKVYDVE